VVEKKKYEHGETAGYGRILAAEYVNGSRKFQSIAVSRSGGAPGVLHRRWKVAAKDVFTLTAEIWRAGNPSHFSKGKISPDPEKRTVRTWERITVRRQERQCRQLGSGRWCSRGAREADGNMVHVAHSNGYETYYLHLSRIFVRAGERVEIG